MKQKWFITIWENGDYFDLWHVNHFLAGSLLGYVSFFFEAPPLTGLWISLILMVAWELYEIFQKIEETVFNRYADVILGLIAFLIQFYWSKAISPALAQGIFIALLMVWVILELWGFYAYLVLKRVESRR